MSMTFISTRSVAARFGRHGMPPPASNNTGTAFCFQAKSRRDVQTMWAYDLDLWPWRSPRLSVIRVLVLCQCTKSKFWWYYDCSFSIYRPLGQHGSDWSRDYATLTFEVMAPVADAGRRPPSVYQVWSSWALPLRRYGARCVSALMGLVILTFDSLTLKLVCERVASKVGDLPSKFGHAKPLGSRIIRYVRDGRRDGQKQRLLPLPYGRRENNKPSLCQHLSTRVAKMTQLTEMKNKTSASVELTQTRHSHSK